MRIVDSHVHIFQKARGITDSAPVASDEYGKIRIGNRLQQFLPPSFIHSDSTAETLIAYMDWQGVDKALLMPNPFYGYHNDYFVESIEKFPQRLRGVALVNILEGEAAARELEKIYDTTPLFGMKLEPHKTFQCAPERQIADPLFDPIWECVNEHDYPLFIHLSTAQNLADAMQLADRFPRIRLVLCHMGADACHAGGRAGAAYGELLEFCRKKKNVYLDTSSISVYYQREEYPFPGATAAVERAYRAVGPEKILFGTDYPGMLLYSTYEELVYLLSRHCNIPESDLSMIMGLNAEQLFFA